jgi:hypothetical protein
MERAERSAERAISNRDLIKFYQFKRTVLFFDEWGFYLLLLTLYKYSYPLWLILPILFYGGGAIFTAYVNLNKVESEIIDVEQDIYVFKDLIYNLYQLNIEILQRAYVILYDYVNRKTHTLKVKFETRVSPVSVTSNDLVMEDIDSNENILKNQ